MRWMDGALCSQIDDDDGIMAKQIIDGESCRAQCRAQQRSPISKLLRSKSKIDRSFFFGFVVGERAEMGKQTDRGENPNFF